MALFLTTQQLGWAALILHHTLSCKQSVCNVAADWILMRRCYFVIPTACARLKSEATPVQHNAFQKRFDLCSSVKHPFFFVCFFAYDCEPRVCFLSPVFLAAICSRSAGFSFTGSGGGGVFLRLACVGLIHHQSFADVCDCYHVGCLPPWCRPAHRHAQTATVAKTQISVHTR